MLSVNNKRFILIVGKSFDIICNRKKLDGLRIYENGRGNRISIHLNKLEVEWLIENLKDFYWNRGKDSWGRNIKGQHRQLFLALVWKRRGRNLVLSEEREGSVKIIFIPDGFESGGWWRTMKAIFELTETPLKNPFLEHSDHTRPICRSCQVQFVSSHISLCCPNCKHTDRFILPTEEKKSYAEALKPHNANPKRVVTTIPNLNRTPKNSVFEIQKLKSKGGKNQKRVSPTQKRTHHLKKSSFTWTEKAKWTNEVGQVTRTNQRLAPTKMHKKIKWVGREKKKDLHPNPKPISIILLEHQKENESLVI